MNKESEAEEGQEEEEEDFAIQTRMWDRTCMMVSFTHTEADFKN